MPARPTRPAPSSATDVGSGTVAISPAMSSISKARPFDVSSSFAMEEIKYTTALPLAYVKDRSSAR